MVLVFHLVIGRSRWARCLLCVVGPAASDRGEILSLGSSCLQVERGLHRRQGPIQSDSADWRAGVSAQESHAVGGAFANAPDRIRTCGLWFRKHAKAPTGSVPGVVPPTPFVWHRCPRRRRRFPGLVGMWRACLLA